MMRVFIALLGLTSVLSIFTPPVMVKNAPSTFTNGKVGPTGKKFEEIVRKAQKNICHEIEKLDGGAVFNTDEWVREGGGGGISAVLKNGNVFEKAGVGVSVVYGSMPPAALQAATDRGVDRTKGMGPNDKIPFFACGISSVMHPRNPFAPTMHFNYRYFETDGGIWWFGGGTDITPSYVDEADMKHFHGMLKNTCDRHDPAFYPKFKKAADDYFVIPHRNNEARGLGGIFYDDLCDREPEKLMSLAEDCLNTVVPAYVPIVARHKNDIFTSQQKEWQQLRRGRYAEFNLIYDRGTIFGLKTGGRVESILMSLPETARWEYDHHPSQGSPEEELLIAVKNPRDWV